jgi:hypothetical protein
MRSSMVCIDWDGDARSLVFRITALPRLRRLPISPSPQSRPQ